MSLKTISKSIWSSRGLCLGVIPIFYTLVSVGLTAAMSCDVRQIASVALVVGLLLLGGGFLDLARAGIFEKDEKQPQRDARLKYAESLVLVLPIVFSTLLLVVSVIVGFAATADKFAVAVAVGLLAGRATIEQMFVRRGSGGGGGGGILIFRQTYWE